VEQSGSSLGS